MKIKPNHFEEIIESGYNLDLLYLLDLISKNYDVTTFTNHKIKALIQTLKRKMLITEEFKITLEGHELLKVTEKRGKSTIRKIKSATASDFEEWWKVYPSSNFFIFKGKEIHGTQKKNIKKEDCAVLFTNIVNEGVYTAEEIINATKYHIEMAKEISYKTGKNELTFIPNSKRYLEQRSFEPYIEASKNQNKKSSVPEVDMSI